MTAGEKTVATLRFELAHAEDALIAAAEELEALDRSWRSRRRVRRDAHLKGRWLRKRAMDAHRVLMATTAPPPERVR